MIQRIQSIWLLLAGLTAFAGLRLPFYMGTNAKNIASYKLMGTESILMMIFTILIGVVALVTIFMFKNRSLQIKLCIAGILSQLVLLYLYYAKVNTFLSGTGAYALTSILQVATMAFFFLAIKGIRNDINTIKDSDRLR